jgi:hypothetical protein
MLIQLTVKVSPSLVERADGLRGYLGEESGKEVTRADVLRRALALGLKQLVRRRYGTPGVKADDDDDA